MVGSGSVPDLDATAAQFAAVGEFLGSLGRPDRVAELVDVLNRGDAIRFEEITGRYGDFASRCSMMCHVAVEVISLGWPPEIVEECTLRTDLSTAETFRAFQIYRKHFRLGRAPLVHQVPTMSGGLVAVEVISPGPYLDELKANSLVACKSVRTPGSGPLTGAREFVCMEVCPS